MESLFPSGFNWTWSRTGMWDGPLNINDTHTLNYLSLTGQDWSFKLQYINGWVQDSSISIANALEILQSCTQPSIQWVYFDKSSKNQTESPDNRSLCITLDIQCKTDKNIPIKALFLKAHCGLMVPYEAIYLSWSKLVHLTLYMLNCSEGTKTYIYFIYILCQSSTLTWHRKLKSSLK